MPFGGMVTVAFSPNRLSETCRLAVFPDKRIIGLSIFGPSFPN